MRQYPGDGLHHFSHDVLPILAQTHQCNKSAARCNVRAQRRAIEGTRASPFGSGKTLRPSLCIPCASDWMAPYSGLRPRHLCLTSPRGGGEAARSLLVYADWQPSRPGAVPRGHKPWSGSRSQAGARLYTFPNYDSVFSFSTETMIALLHNNYPNLR